MIPVCSVDVSLNTKGRARLLLVLVLPPYSQLCVPLGRDMSLL